MLKNWLVFADRGAESQARLDCAAAMAEDWGGHLTCVAIRAHPSFNLTYESVAASQKYFEEVKEAHADAAALAEAVKARLAERDQSADVRWGCDAVGGLPEIAAIHGYYCDLALVAQPGEDALAAMHSAVLEGILFSSGRPAVMIPHGWGGRRFGERIVVAWTPAREAARALHDAMALLRGAASVSVAIVDPTIGERSYGEEPGADIAAALARSGVNVTVDRLASGGGGVAATLRGHAKAHGADLIVMGGYGHSRLRQAIFGGVTRDMIAASTVPVLLSH